MKSKIILLLIVGIISLFSLQSVNATCALDAELINQDPYPALPGDYVEVLFQVSGLGGSDCDEGAAVDLILSYPFSLDDGISRKIIRASTYAGYGTNSNWNNLYKIRIDENALEGDYEVELRYKDGSDSDWSTYSFKRFNIRVEGGKTDFEVHVENYIISERNIVFEILNTGNQDIEALTIEIPKQNNIDVKGSNRNIVGDLDSNEYTTADFEAMPSEGEIDLLLTYTDPINERRTIQKTVNYDPKVFVDTLENTPKDQTGTYITIGIILVVVIIFFVRRHIKKKNSKKKKNFSI